MIYFDSLFSEEGARVFETMIDPVFLYCYENFIYQNEEKLGQKLTLSTSLCSRINGARCVSVSRSYAVDNLSQFGTSSYIQCLLWETKRS